MAPSEADSDAQPASETDDETPQDVPTDSGSGNAADLEPAEAWELHENGNSYREIADMKGVSKSTVERRVRSYRQGRNDAIDTADRETLQEALSDRMSDDDTFQCGECGSQVEYLQPQCGNCGETMNWGAV